MKDCFLVFDPGLSGHRENYLEEVLSSYLEESKQVLLAMERRSLDHFLLRHPHLKNVVALPLEDEQQSAPLNSVLSKFRRQIYFWRLAARASKLAEDYLVNARQLVVVVPYIDNFLSVLALLGNPFRKRPMVGITMRTDFHLNAMRISKTSWFTSMVKGLLLLLAVLRLRQLRLISIDPTLIEYTNKSLFLRRLLGPRLHYMPDPVSPIRTIPKAQAHDYLGLPPNTFVLLVFGAIDKRKGLSLLLTESMAGRLKESGIHILIAGKQAQSVVEMIAERTADSPSIRKVVTCLNRRLDDKEQGIVFSAADAAWLCYLGHDLMSGVLLQAAQVGIPLISFRSGLIGWFNLRYQMGVIADDASEGSLVNALLILCDKVRSNVDFSQEFIKEHNWSHAKSELQRASAF